MHAQLSLSPYAALACFALRLQAVATRLHAHANAMAARTDVTKKVTGSQKRDIDYLTEYAGYLAEYEAAKTAAEKTGAAFDDGAVLGKIKGALGISTIDAELDSKK